MEKWEPNGKHSAARLERTLREEAERKALRANRRREIPSLGRLSAVLLGCVLVIALLPRAFGL